MPERVTASALSVPQRLALIAGVVAALMLAAIAVASGAIGGDDRTSNLSQQAPATSTPPVPTPTPSTILGTTDGPLQIGGGPPRFATGDSSDLPSAQRLPLPDTANAVDAATGRAQLAEVPVVRDVLEAIETRDIDRLAGMVQTYPEVCGGRTEELRRRCVEFAGPDFTYEAASVSGTSQGLQQLHDLLEAAIGIEPVELVLATRAGSRYFLVFEAAPYSTEGIGYSFGVSGGTHIALPIYTEDAQPIPFVTLMPEGASPLSWTQAHFEVPGTGYQQLILPESLDGFERSLR